MYKKIQGEGNSLAIKKGDMETSFDIRTHDAEISLEEYQELPKAPLYIICDNLRSAFNVGAIFRLSDTMRISGLFLCGYTAFPPHKKLDKTSLGTVDFVPWKHFDTVEDAIEYCHNNEIAVWGCETTEQSKIYTDLKVPEKVAIVLGNEALGIQEETLKLCDEVVEIPTFGYKNSLNVATACSVIGYSLLERMGKFNQEQTRSI